MKILIVGGGVAGLTLAGLLRQHGESVRIVEKATTYNEVGYTLSLWPLGNRVLHGLRAFEAFVAASAPLERYTIYDADGRRLRSLRLREQVGEFRTLRRADLLTVLRTAATTAITMGCTVTELAQDGAQACVRLSDGACDRFDLVIGADGIHSHIRQLVFGQIPYHDMGWQVWGWWQTLSAAPVDEVREFWGTGRFLGVYPVQDAIACAAVLPNAVAHPAEVAAQHAQLQRHLAGFGGAEGATILAHLAPTTPITATPLADLDMPHWRQGRVILIGDASAAFLPTAGIGASVAMESAAVLSDELSRVDAAHIPLALDLFVKRRRARVDALQRSSRRLAQVMFPGTPLIAALRNRAVRLLPDQWLIGDFTKWLHRPL